MRWNGRRRIDEKDEEDGEDEDEDEDGGPHDA